MRNLSRMLLESVAPICLSAAFACSVGVSDYSAKATLNHITGTQAMFALPSTWIALFTGVGTDAGSGFTEVAGSNYSRVQVAGNAATNAVTANGNNTLHFAATPAWLVPGMYIFDTTTPSSIPAGTTIVSTTGTTVVMSANAAGAGVGNGDSITFSAFQPAIGTAPSSISNAATITFPTPSGTGWGTIIAYGLYDAATVGNLLQWDYLGAFNWLPCTISAASPGVITAKAHGYSASDSVVYTTEFGGTTPTFSQSNLTGVLAVVGPAADTFTVTNAAVAVNTSTTGSGMVRKIQAQPIAQNVIASFAGGNPGVLQVAFA